MTGRLLCTLWGDASRRTRIGHGALLLCTLWGDPGVGDAWTEARRRNGSLGFTWNDDPDGRAENVPY
jgi:hypothetical protein